MLSYDHVQSYLCNICGRPACTTGHIHLRKHGCGANVGFSKEDFTLNGMDYNGIALKTVSKYKKMTSTKDISVSFAQTDAMLYDFYLFGMQYLYAGYIVHGVKFHYATRGIHNGNI